MIGEHKARLFAARPRVETVWQHKMEPGREHVGEDGGKIIATDKELIHIGHNGAGIVKQEPNGGTAYRLVSRDPLTAYGVVQAYARRRRRGIWPGRAADRCDQDQRRRVARNVSSRHKGLERAALRGKRGTSGTASALS